MLVASHIIAIDHHLKWWGTGLDVTWEADQKNVPKARVVTRPDNAPTMVSTTMGMAKQLLPMPTEAKEHTSGDTRMANRMAMAFLPYLHEARMSENGRRVKGMVKAHC